MNTVIVNFSSTRVQSDRYLYLSDSYQHLIYIRYLSPYQHTEIPCHHYNYFIAIM